MDPLEDLLTSTRQFDRVGVAGTNLLQVPGWVAVPTGRPTTRATSRRSGHVLCHPEFRSGGWRAGPKNAQE
jgi:hypothetical protein